MSAIMFASAYKQLQPAERSFVDSVVAELENAAHRAGERISLALNRAIPPAIVDRSRGLLDRPMVRAAISERVVEIAAAQELTSQRWIKETMAVSFASMGDYMRVEDDGTPYFDLTRCTPEQLAAIKSIDIEETGNPMSMQGTKRKFKIQLHDKLTALKMLGQFMGLQEPDNPVWRADTARVSAPALNPGMNAEEIGDAYAGMIGE